LGFEHFMGLQDVEILFPILPFLPRDDVLRIFPHMVNLPMEKFQVALSRVLQVSYSFLMSGF
jgi:symplekin